MKTIKLLGLAALLAFSAGTASSAGRDIYPDPSQAKSDLAAALKTAAASHKRVLIDFGGNWCGDCQVLDLYFHNAANLPILESNFVLVHVNIGHLDENLDIAERYDLPVKKGVPAVVVLSETGKVLFSQKNKEIELAVQRMEPAAVTQFLIQWKPVKPGCSAVMINC